MQNIPGLKLVNGELIAAKMVDTFIKELYELKRKPKLTPEERKELRRMREALVIVGGKKV